MRIKVDEDLPAAAIWMLAAKGYKGVDVVELWSKEWEAGKTLI